jgi:hypothetical protein
MASNLFIALGGTGFKVVSRLQQMNIDMYSSGVHNGGTAESDPNYYVYLDTDQVSTNFATSVSGNTTVLDLGPFRPADYYKTDSQKQEVNSWFDTENITMPPSDLKAGAKGIRQLVRMGYYYEPKFNKNLEGLLNKFLFKNKQAITDGSNVLSNLKVYVVSGSAGGTGSGIFTDVIYTIWRYFIEKDYSGNMNVKAIILMPNSFLQVNDPDLKLKYKMNGYAFMNEVNAIVKFGLSNLNDQFYTFVPKIYNGPSKRNWQPLNAGVIIDDLNQHFRFNQNHLYDTITEFLYTYTFGRDILGNLKKTVNSESKSIEDQLDSALTNSEPSRNLPQVDFFNSFGLLVVQSATAEHFPDFVNSRFRLDVLEYLTEGASPSGADNLQEDNLFKSLNKSLSDTYSTFENLSVSTFQSPKLDKSAKADYARLLKVLIFGKPIPKPQGPGLESVISSVTGIEKKLKDICTDCNIKILNFIQEQLFEGIPVKTLQNVLGKLDDLFYQAYLNEHKTSTQDKTDDEVIKDAQGILKNRAKMYFHYKLSKGSEAGNSSGHLDDALKYLNSISKELVALKNIINDTRYEPFIDSLLSLQENGAKMIVPDVETLIDRHLNKWIVNPDGALVKWYNELQADWKSFGKQLMVSVFDDAEFKGYLSPVNLDVKKLNSSLIKHLDELADIFRTDNEAYKARMDKSLLQIISEENCETALQHLKKFDYPFIKLTEPHTVSKKAFAGYQIENDTDVIQQIGYDPNEFNDIMLDDVQFKHKIVKIVFFHKLSFSDYFNFDQLRTDFHTSFTKLKKDKKIVSSPFIHKALSGTEFDGDCYSVLSSASTIILNESFNELPDIKKQIVLKYGLVYYTNFVKSAKAAGILEAGFNESIVRFETADNSIHYGKIEYDNVLGEYKITAGDETKLLLSESVSVQGHKGNVSELLKYLKENILDNKSLDNAAVLVCHKDSYRTVASLLEKEPFAEVLSSFANLRKGEEAIKSDFLEYFISVMS